MIAKDSQTSFVVDASRCIPPISGSTAARDAARQDCVARR